jgi:DNA-binding TFAR19-related protein (PDSD5 family)
MSVDQSMKNTAIAAMYQEAHDRLIAASLVLREVVNAAEAGQMNLARGTALEAELSTAEAVKLMECAAVLHGLRG